MGAARSARRGVADHDQVDGVMAKVAVNVTIDAGEQLSSAADLSSSTLSMILVPQQWTAANLSFLISGDNVDFYDLIDDQTQRAVHTAAPPGCAMPVTGIGGTFVKLRSGLPEHPINQSDVRVVTLLTS
jgi:hypothetical protein